MLCCVRFLKVKVQVPGCTGTVYCGTNAVLGLGQRPLQHSSNIHVNKFYVCNVYHILRPYVFAHFDDVLLVLRATIYCTPCMYHVPSLSLLASCFMLV